MEMEEREQGEDHLLHSSLARAVEGASPPVLMEETGVYLMEHRSISPEVAGEGVDLMGRGEMPGMLQQRLREQAAAADTEAQMRREELGLLPRLPPPLEGREDKSLREEGLALEAEAEAEALIVTRWVEMEEVEQGQINV